MIKKYELRPSIVIYPKEKNEPFGSENSKSLHSAQIPLPNK